MTESIRNTTDESTSRWKAYFWPSFVIALLSGQMILILSMVYLATSDQSFAVEPDYYQKGLNWDDIAAQRRHNEELGWKIKLQTSDDRLRCTLTDRNGQPLDNALVDLIAFPHARGMQRDLIMLEPAGDGVYTAPVQFSRAGLWEFRFVIRHDGQTFTHTEHREI